MVKTFLMYWRDVPLTFYTEGFTPDYALLKSILPLPEWQVAFKARYAKSPTVNGRAGSRSASPAVVLDASQMLLGLPN